MQSILVKHQEEYDAAYDAYLDFLRSKGIELGQAGSQRELKDALIHRLTAKGAWIRNGGASVAAGAISPACEACTGGEGSETLTITLRCNRNCYFCFNPNQADYESLLYQDRNWRAGFDELEADSRVMTHIGLTGGEPLLIPHETLDFFSEARKRWPCVHLRLYTTGDYLTEKLLHELISAGLNEIRFSIKTDESAALFDDQISRIKLACSHNVEVMVEMPVIPGELDLMKLLLLKLDDAGVVGINLLEFCYPMNSWEEFGRRGLKIANPPFPVLYQYEYAGGLPVEGSENDALQLVEFALDENLELNVHYCSLENKHRDQVLTTNHQIASIGEPYQIDPHDFFIKVVKFEGSKSAQQELYAAAKAQNIQVFVDDEGCLLVSPQHQAFVDLVARYTKSRTALALFVAENSASLREVDSRMLV